MPTPPGGDVYAGIEVGFTAEGYPYRGQLDAPLQLIEYSDYLCPFCGRHFNQTLQPFTEEFVKSGQVVHIFRDFPIAALHPTAPVGHQAALCVAEQGAEVFWRMHDALFARQTEWNQLPDPTAFVAGVAKSVGADTTAYESCMTSGRTKPIVDAGVAEAEGFGFNATPTFRFVKAADKTSYTLVGANPLAVFQQWVSDLNAGKVPSESAEAQPTPAPAELPFWATSDGLKPDPARAGYTVAGDAYKGSVDARLTVVEFSDFQCPACKQYVQDAQATLDDSLVKTGQVRWVFKHLPLSIHPQAPVSAVAAECAGDQGKFWEMHDALYASQDQWSVDRPEPLFQELAAEIGLDGAAFDACLNNRQALERVLADMYDAQAIPLTSTPSFVFIDGATGSVMRGARPAVEFKSIIENLLKELPPAN